MSFDEYGCEEGKRPMIKRHIRNVLKGYSIHFVLILLCTLATAHAGQWLHPKDIIKDPALARLQQGRKELSPQEKEEIKKYGYTGLEIITYADANYYPGKDWDAIFNSVSLGSDGHIRAQKWIQRTKWCYGTYQDLLTYNGIKPGDIRTKRISIHFYPPEWIGNANLSYTYLEKEGMFKDEASWIYLDKLRKIRHFAAGPKQDHVANMNITYDDYRRRNPWEESHKVLGLDSFNGQECFVIESKHRLIPNYYLSKRVIWIEKGKFLPLHEEQFNREDKLFFMIDKEWQQVKPWSYWVTSQWNIINLSIKSRSLYQSFDWIFDQGLKDEEFTLNQLRRPKYWRDIKIALPEYKKAEDFPPAPQIKWDFWERIGIKPAVVK